MRSGTCRTGQPSCSKAAGLITEAPEQLCPRNHRRCAPIPIQHKGYQSVVPSTHQELLRDRVLVQSEGVIDASVRTVNDLPLVTEDVLWGKVDGEIRQDGDPSLKLLE